MQSFFLYAVLFGFVVGILVRSFFDFSLWFGALFVLLSAAAFGLGYASRVRWVFIAALFFLALTGGYVRMHVAAPHHTPLPIGEEVTILGTVVDDPDQREHTQNITVQVEEGAHVLVRTDVFHDISYGDTLSISGVIEVPKNFGGETGRTFNYQGFLAKDQIHALIAFPKIDVVAKGDGSVVYRVLFAIKHHYLDALARTIPEPGAALAGGITVGDKQSLGGELQDDFRKTGLIHIVVLSGYNVTIIIVFFTLLFAFLPRNVGYLLAALGIIAFTLLVGASATVVRAAIMGIIGAVAVVGGRTYDITRALLVAGVAMLFWNPYFLAFDPSFQLSFVATFGLIFGTPLLTPHLTRIPEVFHLREITAATIATQVAVVPALVYMMGDVSLVALPVNLLVLPIIPLAMLFVFLAGFVGMFTTILSLPFAWIAHGLLLYVLKVVDVFAALPFASVSVPEVSLLIVAGIYALMAYGVWRLYIKQ